MSPQARDIQFNHLCRIQHSAMPEGTGGHTSNSVRDNFLPPIRSKTSTPGTALKSSRAYCAHGTPHIIPNFETTRADKLPRHTDLNLLPPPPAPRSPFILPPCAPSSRFTHPSNPSPIYAPSAHLRQKPTPKSSPQPILSTPFAPPPRTTHPKPIVLITRGMYLSSPHTMTCEARQNHCPISHYDFSFYDKDSGLLPMLLQGLSLV